MTKQFKQGNPHNCYYPYYNRSDTYVNKWCPQCNNGQLYVRDTGQGVYTQCDMCNYAVIGVNLLEGIV